MDISMRRFAALSLGSVVTATGASRRSPQRRSIRRSRRAFAPLPDQEVLQTGLPCLVESCRLVSAVPVMSVVAGDDDAVDILRVLLIAQELYEHVDKLIEHGLALWLYLRGPRSKNTPSLRDDVAVVADADLALVAHDVDDAVAYLFKYRHTQHGDALHLGAHFKKLAVCGLEIFLLIADELSGCLWSPVCLPISSV